MQDIPSSIRLRQKSRVLELTYPDGTVHALEFELLRVYSPSAEVRGHGHGPGILQTGKRHVMLVQAEPIGNYALKLTFDDGHDSGLYTWSYLSELGVLKERYWADYLERLEKAGKHRDARK